MFPLEFRLVELEKLVAAQRYVNLDYVEQLTASLPPKPGMEDLIRFCLSPQRPQPLPKSMQMAPNAMSYSSPSADFRFLGGFPKALSEGDVKAAIGGGVPVAAIVLLVGYGSSTCNAFSVDNRIILNNGFHRVYTLLDMGVKLAPLVIQKITNPGLELPPQIAGLPSDYLVDHARPVLMKDFFDTELVRVIHKKPRIKSVQVAWNSGQSFVPI
jgi:hypothetical protein